MCVHGIISACDVIEFTRLDVAFFLFRSYALPFHPLRNQLDDAQPMPMGF
jgi:hypothetical protein